MPAFQIGDRVRVIQDFEEIDTDGGFEGPCPFNENSLIDYGMYGYVRGIESDEFLNILVVFDDDIEGHSAQGRCEDGHGYWVNGDALKVTASASPVDKKLAVLARSQHLNNRFNERKHRASANLSVQDVESKCKVFGHKLISQESST